MKIAITHNNIKYDVDLKKPIDISVPIQSNGVNAWGMSNLEINPVQNGHWIGDVAQGASVNFNSICFNPHAHTTHTECVGHISPDKQVLNNQLTNFFFIAKLITVCPKNKNKDRIITKTQLLKHIQEFGLVDAVIIRTLPNEQNKITRNYSGTNPPYLSQDAANYLVQLGVKHLLIDTPSVDKEDDGGALIAHKIFWQFPENPRFESTITELIYVPDEIKDGQYLLNLQFVPFQNDASPSRPVLFKLEKNHNENG